MAIIIVEKAVSKKQLGCIAREYYEDMIKGVVDIQREIIALGGEMHADAEEVLLKDGSRQPDLWGFNILLDEDADHCLVYESFINIRPRNGNRDIRVEDPGLRERMREIIFKWVDL